MKRLLTILFLSIFFLSCSRDKGEVIQGKDIFVKEQIIRVKEGVAAPDFTLKDLEGKDVTLSDYRGKVLLINFWASWCGPCVYEMPALERLYSSFIDDQEIEVLLINLGEDLKTVKKFIDEGGYSIPVLLDSDNKVGLSYGVRSIPTTVIIDKNGYFAGSKIGAHEWDNKGVKDILESLK